MDRQRSVLGKIFGALIGASCAALALAGPIVVDINNQRQPTTYDSGQPIALQLSQVASNTLVRIYDVNVPSLSAVVGAVTISGALASANAVLSVLVSGDAEFPAFGPDDRIDNRGAISFAGLTVTDPALRARTRLAVAVTDQISGTISVGQVFRLQAGSVAPGTTTPSGRINATITASAPDGSFPPVSGSLDQTIGVITAGQEISGSITADAGNAALRASIGRIVLWPSEDASRLSVCKSNQLHQLITG